MLGEGKSLDGEVVVQIRGQSGERPVPSKQCKDFNTDDDGELRRTAEVALADARCCSVALRDPRPPSVLESLLADGPAARTAEG